MKRSSHLNQERNMHRSIIIYKWKQPKTVLNKYVGGFWCETITGDGLFHWRMYYGLWTDILAKSNDLKLKRLDGFISYKHAAFHKMLIDGLESCVLLVDFCDVFISCLDSHSDGTHSQSIDWWSSDVMLNFSKSVQKQAHLHLGWHEGEYFFSKFSFLDELFL